MNIGFINSADQRKPCTSVTVAKLEKAGHQVMVDSALGIEQSNSPEKILAEADIIVSAAPLTKSDYAKTKNGARCISIFGSYQPDFDEDSIRIDDRQFYSLDMIPRSTLAQSVDVLSSMASLSGYSAVLIGAEKLPRQFPLMMTAAGTIKPANVLVIGAGVAGLQAIATARKLGARVEAFDVRAAVKEEVQSLGAKFVEVEGSTDDASAGGYAVQQTEEYKQRQKEAIAKSVAKSDVVITTAQLRGRPAPILVDKGMMANMKPGSVLVDLAASTGGNVEGCKNDEIVEVDGKWIIGDSSLYLRCLHDASDLLSNNFYNYIAFFQEDENGQIDDTHDILTASNITLKS